MQGVQNEWVMLGNQNEIRIANIPYGHYILEMKTSNNSGIWMKQPLQLSVYVSSPFWHKWWFLTLLGIVLLAMAVLITRSQAQRSLKLKVAQLEYERSLETERQRIAREMHDDIGAGLTQIGYLSEGVRMHALKKVPIEGDLKRISDKVRELVKSVSEIVWSLNSENNTLQHLIYKLREQAAEQLDAAELDFSVQLPEEIPAITISSQVAQKILQVIKEAFNHHNRHR